MKKFRFDILSVAAAIVLASAPACSLKEDIHAEEEGEGIVLRFFSDENLVVTKATTPKDGVEALNENVLSSVEYFLYSNANKDGDAVLHGYLTNVRQNAPVSIPMTSDIVNYTLCPQNATNFWVYAIANHPRIVAAGDPENLSGTDYATLAELTRDLEFDGENVKTPQTNFLMSTDGPFEVTQVKRRNTIVATANIGLKRVAAKITVSVRVVPRVEIRKTFVISGNEDTRTEIWTPRLNEAYVQLVNGAKTGRVSGEPVDSPKLYSYQQFTFDTTAGESHSYDTYTKKVDEDGNEILDANGLVQYTKETKTGVFYPAEYPFYTYPEQWMYGSEEEPYLKIAIPWDRAAGRSDGGTDFGTLYKIYYYRVYCPATAIDISNAEFVRNNWYKVILNIGILGSEMDGGEMIINGQYYVVDWQERETGSGGEGTGINDSDKEAEIKGARYLFLNEQNFTMYNLEDLMIPYTTSDPCEIVDFKAVKYDFAGSAKEEVTTTSMADWNMDVSLVTTTTGAHISFNHPLNNDTSTDNYDVSPYIITFTIRHKDDPSYAKEVTIEQRPAIMIDMEDNSNTTNNGYVYVNNGETQVYYNYGRVYYTQLPAAYSISNSGGSDWQYRSIGTNGTSSGTNMNFNMFIIETTVLPPDSDYMLGDPRVNTIDNLNTTNWPTSKTSDAAGWSANTTSIQGNNRRLSYYYPVDNTSYSDNIIAPKFRVASSHGATTQVLYAHAFRRCASYQEDGYPAGRWRLPTMAEVSYITKLNADGMIVRLFGSANNGETSEYWCNSGYITVYDGTDAASKQAPVLHPGELTGTHAVRCVYDEWYWNGMKLGNTDVSTVTPLTTFKWGDMAR